MGGGWIEREKWEHERLQESFLEPDVDITNLTSAQIPLAISSYRAPSRYKEIMKYSLPVYLGGKEMDGKRNDLVNT